MSAALPGRRNPFPRTRVSMPCGRLPDCVMAAAGGINVARTGELAGGMIWPPARVLDGRAMVASDGGSGGSDECAGGCSSPPADAGSSCGTTAEAVSGRGVSRGASNCSAGPWLSVEDWDGGTHAGDSAPGSEAGVEESEMAGLACSHDSSELGRNAGRRLSSFAGSSAFACPITSTSPSNSAGKGAAAGAMPLTKTLSAEAAGADGAWKGSRSAHDRAAGGPREGTPD